jgi:cobalt/nickel transport system permease protein
VSRFATIADRHIAGTSVVHRLDPRTKLPLTLAFIFTAILTPQGRWDIFAALGTILLVVCFAAQISPLVLIRRSLIALPFVLAAVPVLFNRPGDSLFSLPVFGWTATDTGLEALASIMVRSWLSVLVASLLTATTEADHILRALRWFGVPVMFVSTIAFMYRYIFVIGDEAQRLMTAREARSARPLGSHGGSIRWRARTAGNMVASLFLRTLNRSERVYVAMLSRGYNGQMRSLQRFQFATADAMAASMLLPLLLAIVIYARV